MNKIYLTNTSIAVHPSLHPSGWLRDGFLLIEDGVIRAISLEPLPIDDEGEVEQIRLAGKAVTPVWVNGHTHLSQTLMRGLAGGRPLLRWLKELIWPLQTAFSPETAHLAALLGLAENIRSAAGLVVDHHKVANTPAHTEAVYRAAQQSGLRVWLARAWSDRGGEAAREILAELRDWFSHNQAGGRVNFANGPLTPWRCSAQTLQASHELAKQFGAFTHIHVSETLDETEMHMREYGLHPIEWLNQIGVLDEKTHIVHAVWVENREIELMAKRGALAVHCPVSNAVLGSGIAPLSKMLERGVRLRLGTDGPASNDTQDSLETMKTAILLARAVNRDSTLVPPRTALQIAWGSAGLSVGQPADLAILRAESVWSTPVQDLDSALALCLRTGNVESLLIGGQFVLRDGRILTIDEDNLLLEAHQMMEWLRHKADIPLPNTFPPNQFRG